MLVMGTRLAVKHAVPFGKVGPARESWTRLAGEDDRETQHMVKLHVAEGQGRELDQSKKLKPRPDEREADMPIQPRP